MPRRRTISLRDIAYDVDAALAGLDAKTLRALLRDLILEADEPTGSRILDRLAAHAVRGGTGWEPAGPSADVISSIINFAREAERMGYAEPWQVDEFLRAGMNAFLSRDYAAAFKVFRSLLAPIGDGDIYLGQDELADEVLSVDLTECAAMHVVAAYISAEAQHRADAVSSAIRDVHGVAYLSEPLREMERVTVDSLPGFDAFVRRWRTLLEESTGDRDGAWAHDEKLWLREAIERMEGAAGLAHLARTTRHADDLRAWCCALMAVKDWKAVLAACVEAADKVTDGEYARGKFLDGAALAAKQLRRRDLPSRLEHAWREAPTMVRLRRWLGTATSRATLMKRAVLALEACPDRFVRQRALLHVILGEPRAAALLLSRAPGLGWSDPEHPGHLLFPLFRELLGGIESPAPGVLETKTSGNWEDDFNWFLYERDDARLDIHETAEIVHLAGVTPTSDDETKANVLRAMRKAAEKRLTGVTSKKRRNYYGHAASLVAACQALDASQQTADWVAAIREKYRRYSALQREFGDYLGQ